MDHKNITEIMVSGRYFKIISARMVFWGIFEILGGALCSLWAGHDPNTSKERSSETHRSGEGMWGEPEVLQSGFGVIFNFGPENFRKTAGEILTAIFSRKLFGLVSPGFQATPCQNSRPKLSALHSNFTFSNPKNSAQAQGQQLQLKWTSDATSLQR